MIDKLKMLIDSCENKPKLKKILLDVAALPEHQQESTLIVIQQLLKCV